jgi:TolA-binding protein
MTGLYRQERKAADAEADPLLERAAAALAEDRSPRTNDEALVARAAEGAMRAAASVAGVPIHRKWRMRPSLLVAAALVLLAGFATGAAWRARRVESRSPEPRSDVLVSPPMPAASPVLGERAMERPEEPTATPSAAASPAPASSFQATPAVLFARANDARRRSDPAAPGFYLDLQKRFPRSAEARLSQVTLGRLYLDRLDDAADALGQFDAYVTGGGGELEEEALVGRALALQRLGRGAEERRAWQRLLAAYPDSISADRARSRLAVLP